jgi:hypothetical protein
VFDRTETATPGAVGFGFDWSFGNLFKNKKDQIIFTIVMIVIAVTVVIAIIISYIVTVIGPRQPS